MELKVYTYFLVYIWNRLKKESDEASGEGGVKISPLVRDDSRG